MKLHVKSMMVPTTFLVLAVGASALSAGNLEESTVRASAIEQPSLSVSYGDLDLGSSEGRETLEYRLQYAAKEVCGHDSFRRSGSLSHYSKTRACYEEATAAALSKVYGSGSVALRD